jgi:heme/copper-type cytochrome/quinol oxidase subunit 1
MLFHDPDTLHAWINVFFAVAAACVAFAFVALSVAQPVQVTEPARRAA